MSNDEFAKLDVSQDEKIAYALKYCSHELLRIAKPRGRMRKFRKTLFRRAITLNNSTVIQELLGYNMKIDHEDCNAAIDGDNFTMLPYLLAKLKERTPNSILSGFCCVGAGFAMIRPYHMPYGKIIEYCCSKAKWETLEGYFYDNISKPLLWLFVSKNAHNLSIPFLERLTSHKSFKWEPKDLNCFVHYYHYDVLKWFLDHGYTGQKRYISNVIDNGPLSDDIYHRAWKMRQFYQKEKRMEEFEKQLEVCELLIEYGY